MDMFLVNKDDPSASGLISKLSGEKQEGAIIPLTNSEMDLYNSTEFAHLVSGGKKLPSLVQVEKEKKYIIVCDRDTHVDDVLAIEKQLGIEIGIIRKY